MAAFTNAVFPVGIRQFTLNGIPNGSNGYEWTMQRDSSWDTAGPLFDYTIDVSQDGGVTWWNWASGTMEGGPAGLFRGVPITTISRSATWPGTFDSNNVRKVLQQTDLRLTLNVARAFTSPLVTLQVT